MVLKEVPGRPAAAPLPLVRALDHVRLRAASLAARVARHARHAADLLVALAGPPGAGVVAVVALLQCV